MKIPNNINAAQNLSKEIASNSLTGNKNNVSNTCFEETLEKAMKGKSQLPPATADKGLDLGFDLLNKEGMLPGNALQDEIGNVLGGLGLGIASSFLAALSGDDSATAVAATPETTDETTAKAPVSAEGAVAATDNKVSAAPIAQNKPLPVADSPASNTVKDSATSAMATAAVTALQDDLLDDDEKNNKTSVS